MATTTRLAVSRTSQLMCCSAPLAPLTSSRAAPHVEPLRLCACASAHPSQRRPSSHTPRPPITVTGVAVLPSRAPSPTPTAHATAPSRRARVGHTRSPGARPARCTLPCSGRVCGRLAYLPVCALLEWAFDAAGAPGQAVGALFQAEDVVAYALAARLVAPALNTFSLHDVTAAVAEAIEAAVGKGSRTGEQPPSSS